MLKKRIIPCLDVKDGRVVKGVNFVNLTDVGDPVDSARAYYEAGCDELVFLDITATSDNRETTVDMVRRVADQVFIPFTVGGGIRSVEDMNKMLIAVEQEGAACHTGAYSCFFTDIYMTDKTDRSRYVRNTL